MLWETPSAARDIGRLYDIASVVKLGQILSTRVDLFAPEWIAEFEKLQDRGAGDLLAMDGAKAQCPGLRGRNSRPGTGRHR
jgi:hypothetical protein